MKAGDVSTVLLQFVFSVFDVDLGDLMKQHTLRLSFFVGEQVLREGEHQSSSEGFENEGHSCL